MARHELGCSGPGYGQVEDSFGSGKEPAGSIKCVESLD